MRLILPLVLALVAFPTSRAVADDINWDTVEDPPIFVGSPSCPAPPGCPVYKDQVNGVTGNVFTLTQASGTTQFSPVNPLLLLVGVFNDNGHYAAPTVTLSSGSATLGGPTPSWVSPLPEWNSSTGYAGTINSGLMNNAYEALNLVDYFAATLGPGNAGSFANWAAADSAALGLNASSFGIYVYELNNTGLKGKGTSVNVTFGGALPTGSFVAAYGCNSNSFPCSITNTFSTPFSQVAVEMGGQVSMPESSMPLALAADLLGVGLLGFVFRRQFRLSGRG